MWVDCQYYTVYVLLDLKLSQKLISWNPTQELNAELSRMTAELAEIEKERKASTIEVGNMEEEIKNLGAEITKMVG